MSRYDESCKADAKEDMIATEYEERTGRSYATHKSNMFFKQRLKSMIPNERDYKRVCRAIDFQEKALDHEILSVTLSDIANEIQTLNDSLREIAKEVNK